MKMANGLVGAVLLLGAMGFVACSSDGTSPGGGRGGTGAAGGQSAMGGDTGTSNGLIAAMSLNFLSGGTIGGSELQGSITLGGGTVSMAFGVSRNGTSPGNILYTPPSPRVTYGGTAAAPCTIGTISTTATGGLYSVSCSTLTGDDGSTCVLGESYVYFQGCTLR